MNAVFERDYVRTSVAPRYLVLRTGFAVVIALVVGLQVAAASARRDYSGVGESVLRVTFWGGLALLFVAVPGSFATSLVHARATNALPILFASPLTPMEVAWGAFLSRAAGYSVFVLACWPPVALALAYGGVRPPQLLHATAALIAALLLLAGPAFIVSAWARSTGASVVASYLAGATILTGLGALGDGLAATSPYLAAAMSPIQALDAATKPARGVATGADGVWVLLSAAAALALACVLLAAWRLDREARGAIESAVDATVRRGYRPIVHDNPILDRELRTAGSLRGQATRRTLVGILVLAEIVYLLAAWHTGRLTDVPLFGGVLVFQTAVLVLAAAAAGATSLAAEKESGGLEVIRVTRIPARQIVEGKLVGLFRTILPALGVPVLHLAWGAYQGIESVLAIPAYVIAGAVVSSTWVIFGMQQSLDQRDPHRAVLRTMGVLGILGFLVAGYAGAALYAAASDVEEWTRLALAGGANPVGGILTWVAALRTGGSDQTTTALPPPDGSDVAIGLVVGLLWLVLHAAAAWAVFTRLAHDYRTRFEA